MLRVQRCVFGEPPVGSGIAGCFEICKFCFSPRAFSDHLHRWRVLEDYWRPRVLNVSMVGVFRYRCWYSIDCRLKDFILEDFYPYGANIGSVEVVSNHRTRTILASLFDRRVICRCRLSSSRGLPRIGRRTPSLGIFRIQTHDPY